MTAEFANAGIAVTNEFRATLTDNSSFEVAFGILLSGNGVMPTGTGGRHDGNHRGIVIYPDVVDSEYDVEGATAVNSFEFGMVIFRFDGAAQDLGNGNQDVTATLRNVVADTTRAPTGSNDAAGIAANTFVGTGVYEVTIENATVRGNFNRGVNVRGTDMTATLSGSEVLGNGYVPTDPEGNDGFSVIVREAATLTVTNTLVQAPLEGVTTDNVQLIHAAANNPLLTVRQSRLDLNQNSDARFAGGSQFTQASGNAWVNGTTQLNGPEIADRSYASIDFSPYLTDPGDTDTGTLGFQADESGYTVSKGANQFANNQIPGPNADRIAEAVALVDNSSRGTVTLEQIFASGGSPFDQPFAEAVTLNRTNLSLVSANNAGFHVQQATASGAFETLGFVDGNRTTSDPQSYRFRAEGLDYGTHTFRLQQVDLDGRTSLSKTVDVAVRLDVPFEVGSVAPNPIRDRGTFDVTVRDAQRVQVLVYDALGRQVGRLHDGMIDANRTRSFDVGTLRLGSGHFFLSVRGETFQETRRVVVVR